MKYHVVINSVKSLDQLTNAWSNEDYIQLLDKFGFEGAESSDPSELLDLLFMAISDFEPEEAAAIILDFKLSDYLNKNQIEQISNEMLEDKISEEYADITLHHQLFNINQLLHKAYNGTFPNAKATQIEFEITPHNDITKEIVLKALNSGLANSNVIKRLYANELAGKEAFSEAEAIIWQLHQKNESSYQMITSEYWISKDEFNEAEFDAIVTLFEDDES